MPPTYADVTRTIPNNTNPNWWKDPGLRKLNAMIVCVITAQMTCGTFEIPDPNAPKRNPNETSQKLSNTNFHLGYDEAVIGNLQSMTPFLNTVGNPSSSDLGLLTTVIFIGAFLGSFPASPIADKWGRKYAMFIGSLFALVGTIVQSLCYGYAQFMVGRGLLGVGIGFILVAGPSLTAELAHPRQRGTVLGFFNTFW